MNFQTVDESPQNQNITMFAALISWEGISFSANQKKYLTCKLQDDDGVKHTCRIYEGKDQIPDESRLGQRLEFSISWYSGTSQRGKYTGYSGFWNSNAQVNQPTPPQGPGGPEPPPLRRQQAPQQPAQATRTPLVNWETKAPQVDWDAKDLRIARMNALTNATAIFTLMKDVLSNLGNQSPDGVAQAVQNTAELYIKYIYEGPPKPEAPTESDIPF